MDALLYYDHYDPIPRPWYRCCGCASSDTPVAGCQCVCHDSRNEFSDEEIIPMKTTLLDYLRLFKPYAPIPSEVLTVGELVEILEELHELRERQCSCFEKTGDNDNCPVHAPIVARAEAAG